MPTITCLLLGSVVVYGFILVGTLAARVLANMAARNKQSIGFELGGRRLRLHISIDNHDDPKQESGASPSTRR
jgi:hypothetical protein